MRKRIAFRKLSKDSEHRWAMLRNMVTSLIHHERIITTTPKAKELRRVAENMVTHAKKGDLHHRRLAAGVVQERSAVVKLFEILGPRYKERPGGYTRILKLAKPRRGDSADMSVIEPMMSGFTDGSTSRRSSVQTAALKPRVVCSLRLGPQPTWRNVFIRNFTQISL